ncbi:hypothetical protein, partial [uncultured Campylobacter sp.]|uniref:hypothetical protein n=1 Tax=uncultured Campylobacter sp. TaxID=218934 RepID=UPI00263A2BEF
MCGAETQIYSPNSNVSRMAPIYGEQTAISQTKLNLRRANSIFLQVVDKFCPLQAALNFKISP